MFKIYIDFIFINQKSKESDFNSKEIICFDISIKLSSNKPIDSLIDILFIFIFVYREDKNIIKIDNYKTIDIIFKDFINISLNRVKGINKVDRYYIIFEITIINLKSTLYSLPS